MTKSPEKNKAIGLRKKGESIKDIAKKIGIAKSTVSLWCRDIELTSRQINKLHKKMSQCGYVGRLNGARMQYERRMEKINKFKNEGMELVGNLSHRDFLIAGIALYWGEGAKKTRCFSFCNSDPDMIKFFIKFIKEALFVDHGRLKAWIRINKIHKNRIGEVEEYWSKITDIPRGNFQKTILIKSKNKKNYINFPIHYGTITIRVSASADLFYKVTGLIEVLKKANQAGVVQW